MRKIKHILASFIAVCLSFAVSSCHEEDPYVVISAVTSCSPDLLDFVTPTVTITGDNGQTQSFVLSPSDFKESDKGGSIEINITVNGQTSSTSSTIMNYIATSDKRFDGETVSGSIAVTYTLKDNYVINSDKYVFYHGVGYDYRAVGDEGISITTEGNYIKPIAYEVSKDEVEGYLIKLVATTDKISFKVNTPTSVK